MSVLFGAVLLLFKSTLMSVLFGAVLLLFQPRKERQLVLNHIPLHLNDIFFYFKGKHDSCYNPWIEFSVKTTFFMIFSHTERCKEYNR